MAFCVSPSTLPQTWRFGRLAPSCCQNNEADTPSHRIPRRAALRLAAASTLALAFSRIDSALSAATNNDTDADAPAPSSSSPTSDTSTKPKTGILTRSGLKYFDFVTGTGARPQWGDIIRIQYVAYTISPDGLSLRKEDSTYGRSNNSGFLIHHGNGEMILGLEEALHSMSVGGRRRLIIPPHLAYNDIDLGPVPSASWTRRRFSDHLSSGDGTVVFDVELLSVSPDPDDRGFYDDLTPDDFEIREMASEARAEYAAALRARGLTPPDPDAPLSDYLLEQTPGGKPPSTYLPGAPVGSTLQ